MAHTQGMARPPCVSKSRRKDQKELKKLLSGGVQQVRVVLRALALLQLAKGRQRAAYCRRCSADAAGDSEGRPSLPGKAASNARSMRRNGPGAAALLEDSQKQRIIAMVCSDPPEGRARWTVRLVAEEAVKRRLVPRVGRETIRVLLLHHDLKPWREKNVVRGRTQ